MTDNTNTDVCIACGSTSIVYDYVRGESYCLKCGNILDDNIIDQGPDWRDFEGESKSHVGKPSDILLPDKGLSTTFSFKNSGSKGGRTSADSSLYMSRLKKWQNRIRVRTAAERNLSIAMDRLRVNSAKLEFTHFIQESTASLYRTAVRAKLIRGRSIDAVLASCAFATCRANAVPRTYTEIASAFNVDKRELARTHRFVVRVLRLDYRPVMADEYVARFISKLTLSPKVYVRTMKILDETDQINAKSGKRSVGIAAAAIYIASKECGEHRTQKEISEVTGVTEVTVRTRYREIQKMRGQTAE